MADLITEIENMIKADGFDEKFVLPSQTKEGEIKRAAGEITAAVEEFDWWYFNKENELWQRVPKNPVPGDHGKIEAAVRATVEPLLEGLRDLELLPVEPDLDDLVDKLTGYIANWKQWYYDWKAAYDQDDWLSSSGLQGEIYVSDEYGGGDSMGVGNAYTDDTTIPFRDEVL